jgi:hypothetical protein
MRSCCEGTDCITAANKDESRELLFGCDLKLIFLSRVWLGAAGPIGAAGIRTSPADLHLELRR